MRRPEKIWQASDLDKEGQRVGWQAGQVNGLEDPVEPVALTTQTKQAGSRSVSVNSAGESPCEEALVLVSPFR